MCALAGPACRPYRFEVGSFGCCSLNFRLLDFLPKFNGCDVVTRNLGFKKFLKLPSQVSNPWPAKNVTLEVIQMVPLKSQHCF